MGLGTKLERLREFALRSLRKDPGCDVAAAVLALAEDPHEGWMPWRPYPGATEGDLIKEAEEGEWFLWYAVGNHWLKAAPVRVVDGKIAGPADGGEAFYSACQRAVLDERTVRALRERGEASGAVSGGDAMDAAKANAVSLYVSLTPAAKRSLRALAALEEGELAAIGAKISRDLVRYGFEVVREKGAEAAKSADLDDCASDEEIIRRAVKLTRMATKPVVP